MLIERGLDVIPQKAIGPYNVDLASGTVAVEVFGGGWHGYGRHRRRAPERLRYILDEGWNLMVIWIIARRRAPLHAAAADYVASFVELASGDPSIRGQHRVVWGDGQEVASVGFNIDDLSAIPPRC